MSNIHLGNKTEIMILISYHWSCTFLLIVGIHVANPFRFTQSNHALKFQAPHISRIILSDSSYRARNIMFSGNSLVEQQSETDELNENPRPKVGDIVRYTGKWIDDVSLGEIRGLQYIASRGKWVADVLPLKDIGSNQYARIKGWGTNIENVDSLKPVRAIYVASANAFQVRALSEKPGDLRYAGERYNLENFSLPELSIVRNSSEGLEEYENLKARILKDTLLFGAFGTLICVLVSGIENGATFALGAASAGIYVSLLERNIDKIGTGGDARLSAGRGRGSKVLDATRLTVPVILVLVLAAVHYVRDPTDVRFLSVIPKEQFISAMLGFLGSYRLPLLYRETFRAVQMDEITENIPGSIFQGSKILKKMGKSKEEDDTGIPLEQKTKTIVVISGPRGVGRRAIVDKFMTDEGGIVRPIWCTSRPKKNHENEGVDYYFIAPDRFDEEAKGIRGKEGAFVKIFEQDGEFYGLRASELLSEPKNGEIMVIDADCDLVRELIKLKGITIIGVWISLSSLEKIKTTIRQNLLDEDNFKNDSEESQLALEDEIRARTKRAVEDIEFGITSNVFEFTVIDGGIDDGVSKLKKAIEYAR